MERSRLPVYSLGVVFIHSSHRRGCGASPEKQLPAAALCVLILPLNRAAYLSLAKLKTVAAP